VSDGLEVAVLGQASVAKTKMVAGEIGELNESTG